MDAGNKKGAHALSRRALLKSTAVAAMLTGTGALRSHRAVAAPPSPTEGTLRIYGDDAYPVPFRRAMPLDAPRARFPGFSPNVAILKAGTVRREGAKPLPCDIVFERDVMVRLRDGTRIVTDVFRPVEAGRYPALFGWSPYGKSVGGQWLDDIPGRSGVPLDGTSELQKFEGPDPAFWVARGYVVLNPEARGSGWSDGDITYWGRQLAEDGCDFIEWAAAQPWCSGKVAMTGNSWLAVSQWFIAAERPPHLAAIAPWEGFCDHFRETGNRGGIPAPSFPEAIITTFAGKGRIEDQPRMIVAQQVMSPYWEDKRARLDRIEVPAYVVASYTNPAHTHGSFEGFRRIGSRDKWLRVNNTNEWLDYYTPKYSDELLRFFDRTLKGIDNGWERMPRVRICVLDPGGHDEVDRVAAGWPLPETVSRPLFLAADRALSDNPPPEAAEIRYAAEAGPVAATGVEFTHVFAEDADVIGYMKLKLWVEAEGSDDMELAVSVEKRAVDGKPIPQMLGEAALGPVAATGLLRVSQRELDPDRSTAHEPYHRHVSEHRLHPGEVVPVEIGLWPMGMRFHAGERLVLTVAAHRQAPTSFDMGFGTAPIPYPADGGTFAPHSGAPTVTLGGPPSSSPAFVNAQRVPTPPSRNAGTHILRLGGRYDSHLLVPLAPRAKG